MTKIFERWDEVQGYSHTSLGSTQSGIIYLIAHAYF